MASLGHTYQKGTSGCILQLPWRHLNTDWLECWAKVQRIGPGDMSPGKTSLSGLPGDLGFSWGCFNHTSFSLFLNMAWVITSVPPESSCSLSPEIAWEPHGWLFLGIRTREKCSWDGCISVDPLTCFHTTNPHIAPPGTLLFFRSKWPHGNSPESEIGLALITIVLVRIEQVFLHQQKISKSQWCNTTQVS